MRFRLPAGAAVAAVCAIALVACNGGGEPEATASASRSVTTPSATTSTTTSRATTTPTTTASVTIPAAARAHTEAGATAFSAFYVDQISQSAYAADSSVLRAISGPACKGCGVFIDLADELRSNGQRVDRKSLIVHGQLVRPDSSANLYVIDALVEDRPSRIVDTAGKTVSDEPGQRFTLRNSISWTDGGWIIEDSLLVTNS